MVEAELVSISRPAHPSQPPCNALQTAVADLEALRQNLKQDRLFLIGHSWGGMLAISDAAAVTLLEMAPAVNYDRQMPSGPLIALLLVVLPPQTGTLTFTRPAAWTDRAAASSMRVAEFVVPKVPGDSEDAEVIVYYFGGSGGSVDANLQRWISQFQSNKDPVKTTSTVNGLKLTSLDVSGTYVAEVRPGATDRHNKPGFRMRATVVETPKGPYFIKLTGPAATVDKAGAQFDQFLQSLAFK